MSEPVQPQQLPEDVRRHMLVKLLQGLHSDMGAVARLLTSNPQPEGFMLDALGVGSAQVRLTRGMSVLEQLLRMNGALPPKTGEATPKAEFQPGTAKDGALVAAFAPAPAAAPVEAKSLDSVIAGDTLVASTNLGTVGAANS